LEYCSHIIPLKHREDRTRIYFVGDEHLGTFACDEQKLDETLKTIKETKNCYWVGMGDPCEFINYTDKRFDPIILSKWLQLKDLQDLAKVQADYFINKYKYISLKCIGLHRGNHDESIRLKYHQDIHNYICVALGIKSLGWSALTNLFFRSENKSTSYILKLASEHGVGGGYYVGGKLNRAVMKTGEKEADIFASGHVHTKNGTVEIMIGSTNTIDPDPKEIPKAIIITGTYLRTYTKGIIGYGEKKSYRPTALGSPYLDIWLDRNVENHKEKNEIKMSLTL